MFQKFWAFTVLVPQFWLSNTCKPNGYGIVILLTFLCLVWNSQVASWEVEILWIWNRFQRRTSGFWLQLLINIFLEADRRKTYIHSRIQEFKNMKDWYHWNGQGIRALAIRDRELTLYRDFPTLSLLELRKFQTYTNYDDGDEWWYTHIHMNDWKVDEIVTTGTRREEKGEWGSEREGRLAEKMVKRRWWWW